MTATAAARRDRAEQREGFVMVYVDDMRAKFARYVMCHMIADTEDELHAMADKIGVARKWYQGDHYDIARSKRELAVACGAREITWRQAGLMMANRRAGGTIGEPETALDTWQKRLRQMVPPVSAGPLDGDLRKIMRREGGR